MCVCQACVVKSCAIQSKAKQLECPPNSQATMLATHSCRESDQNEVHIRLLSVNMTF